MANNITVGYEGLQQAANQLRSGRQELGDILKDLRAVIDGLTSAGFRTRVASGRFGQSYQQWDRSANELLSSLDDISRAIQDARQKHEQADRTLAAGVGAIGATAAGGGIARAASGRSGGGASPGGGAQPAGPPYDVVNGKLVTQRMREIRDSDRLGWGRQHSDGSRYAYDRVRLRNGDTYTRTQGMQATVTKVRDGPRTSSPPPSLKKVMPGYDNRYGLQLGHLWADRLGGPNAPRNFVPVHPGVNGGGMAYIEGQVAAAVEQYGRVDLVALPHYVGSEPIPRSILYAWKPPGASEWTAVNIENVP